MKTTPVFIRKSTPDQSGYRDEARIYKGEVIVYTCDGSTCPNPYSPSRGGLVWSEAYAFVACGKYKYRCVDHDRFGKSLIINEGKIVPTINPNRRHGNKYYAAEIFVHSGGMKSSNSKWRGSAGCLTIDPDKWAAYMDNFKVGESGEIIITDDVNFDADNIIQEGLV